MKRWLIFILITFAGLYGPRLFADAHKPDRLAVGYFQQWPTPAQFSQEKKTFDSALGLGTDWIPFDSASDMRAAIAAGRVQIAYALGHVPFLVGVSTGLDMTMVGIAVGRPDSDNCIVHRDAAIARGNAGELEGRKVALETGKLTHYRMLKVLEHLRVDGAAVEIVAVDSGEDAAAALRAGEVVMACASGSALAAMAGLGQPLMSGAEQAEIGLELFDVVAVATDFMNQHPEIVQSFMDVIEATNQQWRVNPDPMRAAIARAARMEIEGSNRALSNFRFPGADEQKTDAWMGARVPAYSKEIADFLVAEGRLIKALGNYDSFVTTRFLR